MSVDGAEVFSRREEVRAAVEQGEKGGHDALKLVEFDEEAHGEHGAEEMDDLEHELVLLDGSDGLAGVGGDKVDEELLELAVVKVRVEEAGSDRVGAARVRL